MCGLKLVLVAWYVLYDGCWEAYDILKYLFDKINASRCNLCKKQINKNKLFTRIKKILDISYADNLCIDCFLKKNNLEEMITNIINLYECDCGNYIKILKEPNYWKIECDKCKKEIIEWDLNTCINRWCL